MKTDVSFCITGWYLSALDSVFLAIYFMEIVLKLYALRSFFFKTGWNIMGKKVILLNYFGFWRRDHNLLLIKKKYFFPRVDSERRGLGAAYHDLSDCTGWVFAKSANQIYQMVRKFPCLRSERKKRTTFGEFYNFRTDFPESYCSNLTFNRNFRIFFHLVSTLGVLKWVTLDQRTGFQSTGEGFYAVPVEHAPVNGPMPMPSPLSRSITSFTSSQYTCKYLQIVLYLKKWSDVLYSKMLPYVNHKTFIKQGYILLQCYASCKRDDYKTKRSWINDLLIQVKGTRRIRKPLACNSWFTNFSSVLPASQVVYQPITHRNLWSNAFI